ncbi:nucleotide sugar aminotransferase [Rhodanobacter thiooxydans]|uniref:Nucleotide sugar aminotransferase n=1 Tax=Rhodanobacter thiooxydans TaxID=416169 RepID=A0A154QN71_9GAMM|nr:DegT/DnrJ/EryC1/StrS family aminotransferase [Rhodanobacter thiooxydans]EIM01925.1 putative nucleotide sugar transaminase [Rhodanobacter thiooxydans LCS2]KZC25278.1 nucleotide sugar aminotransferase [Rhodanobacter thiooxydans]
MLPHRRHELPPTAGLPLRLADLRPGAPTLADDVAALLGTPPLSLTCSGTAALLLALATLRELAQRRRRVVVPAYTCPLVAIAVQQAGLELQLCDLRPGHYDMDPSALRAACDERTLAIVPTHLAGRVADVDDALAVAREVGAYVIEDAAQALGARRADDASVGLAGDVGFFSLAAGKGLSIYEGGLLAARDPALRERLADAAKRVPPHAGWEWRRRLELLGYAALYRPWGLRLAYGNPLRCALRRGDEIAAVGDDFPLAIPLHRVGRWRQAVGARAVPRLPALLDQLSTQAQRRLPRLRQLDGIEVLEDPAGAHGTWPFFLLLLPDRRRRDAALAQLWQGGYGVSRLFIHALPDYPYLAGTVPAQDVPHARDFAARSLSIGNSPWMTDADFEAICDVLGGG